ncbi:MAG: NADP-dependent oxidoreductase [Nocardioidaceae bacterium]|nr:NADP-dependent oxidoreductase [Nocardioidaceae bacterium]
MTQAVVATAFGGPDVLSVVDVDVPEPQAGEVTIDVRGAGINPVDYKFYSGAFGSDQSQLPMHLGMEVSGVVSAAAPDAQGPAGPVAVDDEVIGFGINGGYAGQVTVPASAVYPKPVNLSWEQAAGLSLTGVTAYHLLEATGVSSGDTVLIHAVSGGVGLTAAQLAVERGARVIGTASESRHESLRSYGVVPVAYGDGLADRVREVAPSGVDVALDTVGTDEAVDVSLELVADRHRIATIAAFGRAPEAGIQLLGNGPGADPGEDIRSRGRLVLTGLASEGKLDVVVAQTFPLDRAADAHRLVADGHAGGKVVLVP